MTESEAREKTCCGPLAAMYGIMTTHEFDGEVRSQEIQTFKCIGTFKCIASDCMAWRWDSPVKTANMHEGVTVNFNEPPTGYCGLAGKP